MKPLFKFIMNISQDMTDFGGLIFSVLFTCALQVIDI
jgi:hypothetical protein